jgi:hypothetical protein
MTRREFFLLLSRSGLYVAGAETLGTLSARAQTTAPAPSAVAASAGPACALNPVGPYIKTHPLPWPVPASTPATQNFDLMNWQAGDSSRKALNQPDGQFSIAVQPGGGQVDYTVRRTTQYDELTAQFHCDADDWHTPKSWNIIQHPKVGDSNLKLTAMISGSCDGRQVTLGRLPDRPLDLPLTTLAALAGSIPVLEHAAQAGGTFYALNESGVLLGPLQARAQAPIAGPEGKPLFQVVALWGPRVVPTHIVYDSAGTAAQTGFLISFVRSTLT